MAQSTHLVREAHVVYAKPKGGLLKVTIADSTSVKKVAHTLLGDKGVEHFVVLGLSPKNEMIAWTTAAIGGYSHCEVPMPNIFRFAVMAGVPMIILVHNHPSGDPSPSDADVEITKRIVEASRLLEIKVVDHVIVGSGTENHFSFLDAGLLSG